MPLGQGIGELWDAVRDRVEVTGTGPTWDVTAGSFDRAWSYVHEAFDGAVVLARHDRNRWWPRVTLTVTTDPAEAASAPPLDELARSAFPTQRTGEESTAPGEPYDPDADEDGQLPPSLEAIFAHQESQRIRASSSDPRSDRFGRP